MATALPSSLLLVGCGKMGGALLEGWLRIGLRGDLITIIDPHASTLLAATCEQHGIALNPSVQSIPKPEVLVLGIKPPTLDEAAAGLGPLLSHRTLLISVLAGKRI